MSVTGIDGVAASAIAVDARNLHTCAILDTGAVRCWGGNEYGQLGDGGTLPGTYQSSPVAVVGIDGVAASAIAVAAGGFHTCALLDTGAVQCWGMDQFGQLRDGGAALNHSAPVDVVGIDGVTDSAVAVVALSRAAATPVP